MKKRMRKAGILLVVFVAAIFVSSLFMNSGVDDQIIDLGDPTLPRISFQKEGRAVNALAGYVNEMDVTAMRDTITPLEANGTLQMQIEEFGNKITGVEYKVYSLNGEETYLKGKQKDISDETILLDLQKGLPDEVSEAVLEVILSMEEEQVHFYTRITRPDELSLKECLDFAQDFHAKTLEKSSQEELENYLETSAEGDNTTYQTVTIHSDADHVTWGNLSPQVVEEPEWSIKESNSVYTSLLAQYQVTCAGDTGEIETYDVREFFRIRCVQGEIYLLDYNRKMEQIFDANQKVLDQNGILLGIASSDISYETNSSGNIVSFVRNGNLWTYNAKQNELAQVFSFSNIEGNDARSRYDQHNIRIISVEKNGSTAFAVYGYMNRGAHEGEVGVDIYYYDIEKNVVQEKAFIPSTKSFAIAEEELGKMVYYNQDQNLLYILAGGKFYKIDLTKDEQTVLAKNLEEGQYTVSSDGHLIAYQTSGTINTAQEIKVLNLKTGEENAVAAKSGEAIRPLGFIGSDFVYGYLRQEDVGHTAAGEELFPMYELEIRNSENEVMKTYSADQIYISDVFIEENMMTLNRVVKSGETYTVTSQDYISSNEEKKTKSITLEAFSTDLKEKQMRLTYEKGISDTVPKILRPKQVVGKKPITITLNDKSKSEKYYVYGTGELVAIYDKAAYAIQRAEQISGVVISSEQAYVWEKGNRDLVYDTETVPFGNGEGKTSLQTCEEVMAAYNAKKVDLTGCSLEQVLYIINKGLPVIAMTDANHAILLTGYSMTDITYIDPDTASQNTVSLEQMSAMIAGSGNTFIGYLK